MSPIRTIFSDPTAPSPGDVTPIDLLVVGGGINGCGIARDAAGRGARVMLVEQDDLASHTSSASTKLIHGGLRYLEYYEFRLVREALIERERLLRIAPHVIWPMRFVLPHSSALRPAWLIRLGLFLYDHLALNMTLPRTKVIRLDRHAAGRALKASYRKGFVYSDGWVQDSRLVVLNAMDALDRGAAIQTHTKLVGAVRRADRWVAALENTEDGTREIVHARAIANAAGPWVASLLHQTLAVAGDKQVRMVKGSHIVVPRQFEGPQAYILQNPDKRIVFAIPYEEDYTLIGTTDVPWSQEPGHVEISPEETSYLCDSFNRYFDRQVAPSDVIWSYAGVRPLYDDAAADASAVTRDYVLDLDTHGAPILSVFGGKITTYRKLAEHALEKLGTVLPVLRGPSWTADHALPGGDFKSAGFSDLLTRLRAHAPDLDPRTAWRLARNYGTRAFDIAGPSAADRGQAFGGGLFAREVDYLMDHEWARAPEDLLWRRSKLGLVLSQGEQVRLAAYMNNRRPHARVSDVA